MKGPLNRRASVSSEKFGVRCRFPLAYGQQPCAFYECETAAEAETVMAHHKGKATIEHWPYRENGYVEMWQPQRRSVA